MGDWTMSFALLKEIRAAMTEEDATEEQIESVLIAFRDVTGMEVLDARSQADGDSEHEG